MPPKSSRFRGVTLFRPTKKWRAQISAAGKTTSLGCVYAGHAVLSPTPSTRRVFRISSRTLRVGFRSSRRLQLFQSASQRRHRKSCEMSRRLTVSRISIFFNAATTTPRRKPRARSIARRSTKRVPRRRRTTRFGNTPARWTRFVAFPCPSSWRRCARRREGTGRRLRSTAAFRC